MMVPTHLLDVTCFDGKWILGRTVGLFCSVCSRLKIKLGIGGSLQTPQKKAWHHGGIQGQTKLVAMQ